MADPNSQLTPEQQLLQLIESQGKSDPAQQTQQAGAANTTGGAAVKKQTSFNLAALLSPAALMGRINFLKDQIAGLTKAKKEVISLKPVNHALKVVLAVAFLCMIIVLGYEAQHVFLGFEARFNTMRKQMADIPMTEVFALNPFFFEEISKRDIFIPIEKRAGSVQEQTKESVSVDLTEMTKSLKLTGISINPVDEKRTFCMIEDLTKSTTNFLKTGDHIAGLEVKEIRPDVVVLGSGEKTIEIR